MPWTNALPPDTRAVGTGNPPADMNAVVEALTANDAAFNVQNPAYAGGADPTGVANSTAAIQAALNAAPAGGLVYFPAGTYTCTSTLSLPVGVRLWGNGARQGVNTTRITSSANPVIGFASIGTTGNEIGFMDIESTGGGDIIGPQIPSSSYFHDLVLRVTNSTGACIGVSGQCVNCAFERIYFTTSTGTRSVPMVNWTSVASGAISNNTFTKCLWGGANNSQFMVYIACTGSGSAHYTNVFRDCYFEQPTGGAIQSLSGQGLAIENTMFWDLATTAGVSNSLVYVGTSSGAQISQGTRIVNCGRNLTNAYMSSAGPWDIQLESTVQDTYIEGYFVKNTLGTETDVYFNLGSAQSVVLLNNQAPQPGGGGSGNALSKTVLTSPTLTSTLVMTSGLTWPQFNNNLQPSGCIAATCDVVRCTGTQAPASGTLSVRKILLPAGLTLSNLTFQTNTVVKAGGTHGWYVLLDSSRHVLAVTADQTDPATVWGVASTAYTLAFTAPYVTAYTGIYYVGVMVAETAGTMPTFSGEPSLQGGFGSVDTPSGTSSTAQTTPPTLGTQMASISGTGNLLFYAYLT